MLYEEIKMNRSVFISYSSKDEKIAKKLCKYLEDNQVTCFIAPRDISYGSEYAEELVDGIDNCKVMLLLLSEESNQSPHVLREVERAVTKSIPILIYKLEDVQLSKSLEYFLMTHQWMNAEKNDGLEKVLKCVQDIIRENSDESSLASDAGSKEQNQKKPGRAYKNPLVLAELAIFIGVAIIGSLLLFSNHTGKPSQDGQAGEEKTTSAAIKVGDVVTLGTYNGEAINWTVLKLSEDGQEAVLIANNILSMKAYDAAEGGKYAYDEDGNSYFSDSVADMDQEKQIQLWGNSDWSRSNIRTWMNSSDELVKYEDQAPAVRVMAEQKNGYDHEPGFLYEFEEEDLAAIKTVKNTTHGNMYSQQDSIVTEDRVYLLSLEELEWFDEAGMSILAEPTQAAVDKDNTVWYEDETKLYYLKTYFWWLREPVEGNSCQCYTVGSGRHNERLYKWEAGLEAFGVRPAITVYTNKITDKIADKVTDKITEGD